VAGLPGEFTPYNARHTGISWAIDKGVDLQKIRQRAGHGSLEVTSRYAAILDERDTCLADALGEIFDSPRSSVGDHECTTELTAVIRGFTMTFASGRRSARSRDAGTRSGRRCGARSGPPARLASDRSAFPRHRDAYPVFRRPGQALETPIGSGWLPRRTVDKAIRNDMEGRTSAPKAGSRQHSGGGAG
jgi:hypothetical protein